MQDLIRRHPKPALDPVALFDSDSASVVHTVPGEPDEFSEDDEETLDEEAVAAPMVLGKGMPSAGARPHCWREDHRDCALEDKLIELLQLTPGEQTPCDEAILQKFNENNPPITPTEVREGWSKSGPGLSEKVGSVLSHALMVLRRDLPDDEEVQECINSFTEMDSGSWVSASPRPPPKRTPSTPPSPAHRHRRIVK